MAPEPEFRTDGPHSPDLTRAAADKAADMIRFLNYATMAGSDGLRYPGDLYELLASLYIAMQRMPQLIAQADAFLAAQYNAGRLAADDGGPVAGAVSEAGAELHYAEDSARDLTARLREAQNAIAGLRAADDG